MTARPNSPLWWLLVLRLRLKLAVWRYLPRRAALRLMRRVLDWMEPPAELFLTGTIALLSLGPHRPGLSGGREQFCTDVCRASA